MASVTVVATEPSFPLVGLPRISCNPWLCSAVVLASDAMALTFTASLVLMGKRASGGGLDLHRYFSHRSFDASEPVKLFLTSVATSSRVRPTPVATASKLAPT